MTQTFVFVTFAWLRSRTVKLTDEEGVLWRMRQFFFGVCVWSWEIVSDVTTSFVTSAFLSSLEHH